MLSQVYCAGMHVILMLLMARFSSTKKKESHIMQNKPYTFSLLGHRFKKYIRLRDK